MTTDMHTPRALQEEMIGYGKKILRSTTWIRRRQNAAGLLTLLSF